MIADYAVVGAGSAGCVIAARLAEAGSSVILIEDAGLPHGVAFLRALARDRLTPLTD
ncbi:MAG: FAD-dependent oxidoreductase [Janthinobacterium lividum]